MPHLYEKKILFTFAYTRRFIFLIRRLKEEQYGSEDPSASLFVLSRRLSCLNIRESVRAVGRLPNLQNSPAYRWHRDVIRLRELSFDSTFAFRVLRKVFRFENVRAKSVSRCPCLYFTYSLSFILTPYIKIRVKRLISSKSDAMFTLHQKK